MMGFLAPWVVAAMTLVLHLALPAREVPGYVTDPATGEPLRYRLNGLLVTLTLVGLWAGTAWLGWLPWDWLWQVRWESLAGSCVLGLLYTGAVVGGAPATGKALLADLYLGRAENPRHLGGRVDAKMFLYLFGAALLELNVLSFAAHHRLTYVLDPSPGVLLSAGLLTWFVADYLVFERVHLWTYDLFAERVGFKLGWGCLTFYPFFYLIGLWWMVDQPNPVAPLWVLPLSGAVFGLGWALARGANLQKFTFKTHPERVFLGRLAPAVVSDGERTLLCSGLWGVARHVNYLGEILMATGITVALGAPLEWVPWLYPLYYVALLVPRERDDDRRCAAKYGALWDEYCARVPHRIVPWLY